MSKGKIEFIAYEASNADKAYMYQQVQGLEALMPQPSSLAVVVEVSDTPAFLPQTYCVSYFVITPQQKIEGQFIHDSLLEAAKGARENLEKKLELIFSSSPQDHARNLKIEKLLGRLSVQ